ncbi:MAG: hypothetical protein ACK4R8_07670 [Thiobacillus sp.]
MLKIFIPLTMGMLAGCASTQQAAVIPPADTAPLPAVAVQIPESTPAPTLLVSDVTPAAEVATATATAPSVPPIAAAASPDPYQCMLSWAKGMQDAMTPWMVTAQRCEPRAVQP